MLENENIIVFSSVDWSHVPTIEKQVPAMLARHNKVLFIETLGSHTPGFNPIHFRRIKQRLFNWFKGIKKVSVPARVSSSERSANHGNGELLIYSPIILPYWLPGFKAINNFLIRYKIKQFIKKFNLNQAILWFNLPTPEYLVGKLGEKYVVYSCVDEWSTYPGGMNKSFLEAEERLLKKADIVFAASKPLLEKKKKLNTNTYYLPHGSDFEHFNKLTTNQKIPEDIKNIKRPILGVIGAVAIWIDSDLVKYIISTHPEWSIVFLGRISYNVDISPLKKGKNIYLLEQKDYNDLPRYYQAIDVCLVPFLLTEHIKYCQPTRLYEHLAAGKPIVSTDFPAAREMGNGLIKIGRNKDEFVQLIEQALAEDNQELIEKRKQIARKNTWEHRVKQMSQLIKKDISVFKEL